MVPWTELQVVNEILDHTREGVTISDADGTILRVNRAFTTITGYSAEEVIGGNPRVLKSNYHDEKFYRDMWQALIEEGHWAGEIWNRRKGGEIYPEWPLGKPPALPGDNKSLTVPEK